MLDRLSEGFSSALRKLSGKGSISESNVREAMEDVRNALLEADVHYDVVQAFTQNVLDDAIGMDVTKSLEPGQEMIGIVHRRLVEFLGGDPDADDATPGSLTTNATKHPGILRISPGPTVVMMCGLQGSGKTTTCGKLAAYLKKRGRSAMLVAADLQRPAAVEQLEIVAKSVADNAPGSAVVTFYGEHDKSAAYGKAVGVAVDICQRAIKQAREQGIDTVILDTAGRLHVNDELMGELAKVNAACQPQQIFLVVDDDRPGRRHQRQSLPRKLEVDGVILTSSTPTPAAAQPERQTHHRRPILFMGTGEKIDALEEFHAERIADESWAWATSSASSKKRRLKSQKKTPRSSRPKWPRANSPWTTSSTAQNLRRMGPMKQLLGLLPGVGSALKDLHIDEKQLDRVEAIVNSMTPKERKKPGDLMNVTRRKRISKGSGTKPDEVQQLTKQFTMMNKMTKQLSGFGGLGGGGAGDGKKPSLREQAAAVRELGKSGGLGSMLPGASGNKGLDALLKAGKGTGGTAGRGFKKRPGGKKRK